MRHAVKRTLSALAVSALALAGVAVIATPAQALPGSVSFSDQNCDIPTGGTLIPFIDGADLTITNSAEVDAELGYSIVLDFDYDSPYEQSTLAPGAVRHLSIPLPEDSSTTIQVFDTAGEGTLLGGYLADVNCAPDYSPQAVATLSDASCAFPSGGIIPPSPGFSFTLDNSAGTGPAAYAFVAGEVDVESGTVAAGETRVRSWSLDEDTPTEAVISSVDADGEPVVLASMTELVNCEADTPVITAPTEGQTVTSPVTITGTGTAGDEISLLVSRPDVVGPIETEGPGLLATAEPVVEGDGFAIFVTEVGAEGTFSVTADLDPAAYQAVAVAAREGNDEGTVPASVSAPSAIVDFTVAAVIPTPTPTPTPAPVPVTPAGTGSNGSLANTGFEPLVGGGAALALLLAGGAALLRRRPRAMR